MTQELYNILNMLKGKLLFLIILQITELRALLADYFQEKLDTSSQGSLLLMSNCLATTASEGVIEFLVRTKDKTANAQNISFSQHKILPEGIMGLLVYCPCIPTDYFTALR